MSDDTQVNCSNLELFHNYKSYTARLKTETGYKIDDLHECQSEICGAIWGEGNPDISGIGVSIGYAISMGLGFFLAVMVMTVRQKRGPRWEFCQLVIKKGLEAFFDFAIYFAISIEVASIYMLVNKDFGRKTDDFGATEAQVALAISVVCILPLLYPVALLPAPIFHPDSEKQAELDKQSEELKRRQKFRLILFSLLAVLFFYPFLSQCIHNWAPVQIGEGMGGDGGETYAKIQEWFNVENMCFEPGEKLTDRELWALAVCEMISSLLILLFVMWHAVGVGLERWREDDMFMGKERRKTVVLLRTRRVLQKGWQDQLWVQALLVFVPLFFGGALLYCIFRLRTTQANAIEKKGGEYSGNDWGFGQVVGIIIFVPVLADMTYVAWEERSLLGWGGYDTVSSRGSL